MQGKLFPRNLTAKADYVVRGNPAASRVESGVNNCFPGLEIDQRNLDKQFFPGLYFEYHLNDGAILKAIPSGEIKVGEDALTAGDISERKFFLWAIRGNLPHNSADATTLFFAGLSGLETWSRIHQMGAGKITLLLGPSPGVTSNNITDILDLEQFSNDQEIIRRNQDKEIEWVVLVGERTQFLDNQGVIDTLVYSPGELTRTLCVPWQYDFRDCGCFYWASNKPDMVSSADGKTPHMNFARDNREDTMDIPRMGTPENPRERIKLEMTHAKMIAGAWNEILPVVLNNRESSQFIHDPAPSGNLMSVEEVKCELQYLAEVEHALCVEYLYAHYSLRAPMTKPTPANPDQLSDAEKQTQLIFSAADEIFRIAVDEMRHLHWVNEALNLLEEQPNVGRAEIIGREHKRPFALKPLTAEQLQWFIDVEAPSKNIDDGIDGMYVHLLRSITENPDFPKRDQLIPLIKLIIDEGGGHYHRFLSVQEKLKNLAPDDYLRPMEDPASGTSEHIMQQLCDENYRVLLGTLLLSFSMGDEAGGNLIKQARHAMFALHEISHILASKGYRTPFTMPDSEHLHLPKLNVTNTAVAHRYIENIEGSLTRTSAQLLEVADDNTQQVMARQQRNMSRLFQLMHHLVEVNVNPDEDSSR